MPIHIPGFRYQRRTGSSRARVTKRNVVAVLQLTAMVDLFTVLVVFLLQNYASTNQILPISETVILPQATSTERLKPSFVVVLSKENLSFNGKNLVTFEEIKSQEDWMIETLRQTVALDIAQKKKERESSQVLTKTDGAIQIFDYEKITLQADETIDFLSIKKVMYTLQEAGIKEINFAVIQIREYPS